jgi:hypothetical protein
MLTFFATAKPFVGHIDMIQRNALASRPPGCGSMDHRLLICEKRTEDGIGV